MITHFRKTWDLGPKKIGLILLVFALLFWGTGSQNAFSGVETKEASFGLESNSLAPNEFFPETTREILTARQGGFFSIGTFRSFENLSYGNFEAGYFGDISPWVSRSNTRMIEALEKPTPEEAFAHYFNISSQIDNIRVLFTGAGSIENASRREKLAYESLKASFEKARKEMFTRELQELEAQFPKVVQLLSTYKKSGSNNFSLAQVVDKSTALLGRPELGPYIEELIGHSENVSVLEQALAHLKGLISRNLASTQSIEYFDSLLNLTRGVKALKTGRLETGATTFFGDSARFQKLHNLARQKKMHAITLNLSGPRLMQRFADRLNADGIKLSVVDLSNTVDYILPMELNADRPGGWTESTAVLEKNLKGLPVTNDAIVNFTAMQRAEIDAPKEIVAKYGGEPFRIAKPRPENAINDWAFFSTGFRHFVDKIKTIDGKKTRLPDLYPEIFLLTDTLKTYERSISAHLASSDTKCGGSRILSVIGKLIP